MKLFTTKPKELSKMEKLLDELVEETQELNSMPKTGKKDEAEKYEARKNAVAENLDNVKRLKEVVTLPEKTKRRIDPSIVVAAITSGFGLITVGVLKSIGDSGNVPNREGTNFFTRIFG